MTLMERLKSFLREHFNQPYCDDCLSKLAQISNRRVVEQKTGALEHDPGFTRDVVICAGCSEKKRTTRASMVAIAAGSAA